VRILHTSDWHLGASDGERTMPEDQKFFIDEICEIVKEQSVDAVIIAGDVYDRSLASAEAIKLYDYAMTRLCSELKVRVLVIAGNHDSAERLSSCRELLSAAGLHIQGALEREISKVSFDDTDIYMIPWITEEKVKSIFPEREDEVISLEAAYRIVTDNMREHFEPGKKNILTAHAFITDAETSTSDRAAEIGFATQVSAGIFKDFDYVALGHIHKPQDVTEKIRYSGTPMPYSFGKEESQEKSVTIIDTSSMSRSIVPLALLHKRTTLTGTLEEILGFDGAQDVKDGYVRVQITDQYIGLSILTELKKKFPNLLEASGKSYEGENSTLTLTVEEFEKLETTPLEVFRYFCREEMNCDPDEHQIDLFIKAITAAEEEET